MLLLSPPSLKQLLPTFPPLLHHHNHNHNRHPQLRLVIKMSTAQTTENHDRLAQLKQFDESKLGVKGLVDQGLTSIPSIFIHPSSQSKSSSAQQPDIDTPTQSVTIPVIDMSLPRSKLVDQIHHAASTLGFFQLSNHTIPSETIDSLLTSLRSFNEQPDDVKARLYRRDMTHGAAFSSNFDLFNSKAASWRDTLQVRLGPNPPEWDHVPEVVKGDIPAWDADVIRLGEELMGLLCEGLGLDADKLKEMSCLDARIMVGHYYPYCPQPELTAGLTSHTDPGLLTVLVQNEVPGLQVKCGEQWVDVEPVPGAVVVNIGDILQIMSNDIYKSVEHRVLANPFREPRVSVAVFFNPGRRDSLFGPFPELISDEKPAVYRQFTFTDYMKRFFSKELDGKTLTNYYRL